MTIKELLLDVIIHSRLFEMAEHRKYLILKVDSYAYQIDTHLLKILMYGDVADYNHWCNELNAWITSVQRKKLKGSKKRLSEDDYMKILWESLLESIEEVQDYMEDIDKEYSSMYKMINYDPAVIHKQLYEILHDICYNISHGNFTDIRNYL